MTDQPTHKIPTVRRRTLLRTALVAPVAGAGIVPGSHGAPTSAASPARQIEVDPANQRFTIAVLPDTQYLYDEDSSIPEPLETTFAWLVREREARNIVFMAQIGDVVEHGSDLEIGLSDETFRLIDNQIPYSVLVGNHDVDGSTNDQRGATAWLSAFGPDRFADSPTFQAAAPGDYNTYHILTAGGREWLIFALDWRVTPGTIDWAQGVIDAHSQLPVILTTHDFVSADNDGVAELSEHGSMLWDSLVRANDQIFLTINGHYWPTGRTVLTNDAGYAVHAHLTNYQDRYFGGGGMIRLYTFDLARDVIAVETFSPWLRERAAGVAPAPLEAETAELSGPIERFTIELPFRERFAGFAPRILPATRPPASVLLDGTEAYWRFDNAGLAAPGGGAVADGTVARDLSGNGNDLTVQRLPNSGPIALTWSAEHDERQPAHASLRFGGGQSPARGALLRTGEDAPLNSLTFDEGYTIEAFVKIPATYDERHAWMGLLSWEGRNGDAGKTSGYSQDEPTCSINLSPEQFLQYVVYPRNADVQPTSWSHALPLDRWMHLAVVNDGRQTVVYVDGSRIARNPTQESRGITTMGQPFVLGGTGSNNAYGQGFYGWIGDVRIVSRVLTPQEFLTPFA